MHEDIVPVSYTHLDVYKRQEYVLDATHATLKHASGVNKTLTVRETGFITCFRKMRLFVKAC